MRKYLLAAGLALALGGCALTDQVKIATYSADLTFDGAVKAFKEVRSLCANHTLPTSCRGYIVQGQAIIAKAYAAEKIGNSAAVQAAITELSGILTAINALKS